MTKWNNRVEGSHPTVSIWIMFGCATAHQTATADRPVTETKSTGQDPILMSQTLCHPSSYVILLLYFTVFYIHKGHFSCIWQILTYIWPNWVFSSWCGSSKKKSVIISPSPWGPSNFRNTSQNTNVGLENQIHVYPGKLRWNRIMEVWKMIFLFKQVIFQIFSGSMLINPPGCLANLDTTPPPSLFVQ